MSQQHIYQAQLKRDLMPPNMADIWQDVSARRAPRPSSPAPRAASTLPSIGLLEAFRAHAASLARHHASRGSAAARRAPGGGRAGAARRKPEARAGGPAPTARPDGGAAGAAAAGA
jgi:hypothetical protein